MTPRSPHRIAHATRLAALAATLLLASLAHGQPALCSSDGQAPAGVLFERFVSADCLACWSDPATPAATPDTLALDWIVPGGLGDDAPLAPAASEDAALRLQALQRPRPDGHSHFSSKVTGWPGAHLSVAHGLTVGAYVGASIELTLAKGMTPELPVQAWLALVETLPAGTEGSPVARNLVRNVLQPRWDERSLESTVQGIRFSELRPMNLPEGTDPARLQLVGWVQDAKGHVLTAVHSQCPAPDKD